MLSTLSTTAAAAAMGLGFPHASRFTRPIYYTNSQYGDNDDSFLPNPLPYEYAIYLLRRPRRPTPSIPKLHQSHFRTVTSRALRQILRRAGAQRGVCAVGFGAVGFFGTVCFGAVLLFFVFDEFLPAVLC